MRAGEDLEMSLNILIVDDSAVMRKMILKTMRMSGLPLGDIYEAADGQQGLDALDENWIDLVMADINMPVMNGEEMIEKIRENNELKETPIIVVSTESSETRINRLLEKGVRFIHKPFSPEDIRDTVKGLLSMGDEND